jgi:two-component system sensor histidine kinase YesM
VTVKKLWEYICKAYTQHVQVRLTLYFLLILLPLVGVSLLANYRSKDILENQISERTRNNLQTSLDFIDLMLDNLHELSVLISTDYSIQPVLHETGAIPLPTDLFQLYTVMERLDNMKNTHGNLHDIAILHVASETLISAEYGGREIEVEQYPWFTAVMQANGKPVLYMPDEQAGEQPLFGEDTVSLIRLMDWNDPDEGANVLIMTVSRSELEERIYSVLPTINSSVYLFSDEGLLVASASRMERVPEWNEAWAHAERTDDGMLLWRVTSGRSGWSLALMQPEKELYDESRNVQLFIYLIIVISVVLAFMISLIVYKGFAAPLSTLLYGMKQIRLGNYDMRLPNKRKDQLGVLTDAFNQMIAEQQRLIRDVYEHQLRLSYTELKFLQSQINPHFLYNTLDSIYWTAKNYDAEEISEMVLNLSKFFRLSLSKGKETFTVAETVEHMRYYLRIQQFRLLGQLDVRFDIAEETKNVLVLKLLLQPIVENAILHGLEKQGGGVLRISSRMDDKYLYLTVADSGPGIATDRLAYIRRELAEFERLARFSPVEIHQMKDLFGLRNVLGRMKLYYGPEAALEIDSRPKAGTTVTLRIPSARAEVSWEEKSA